MVTTIQLKKHVANICILCIVISKLDSIILLKVDKSLKIHFYCIILMFDLAVSLKIEDGGELPLDFKKIIKQRPKLQDEEQASIGDNQVEQAMLSYYHV